MGILELIGLRSRNKTEKKFVGSRLESLINDPALREYFFDEDGKRKTGKEAGAMEELLKEHVGKSYRKNAKDYFNKQGILGKYVSRGLRYAGFAANIVGSGLFYVDAGPGLVSKTIGLAVCSLADLIDGYKYVRHAGRDSGDVASLIAETAAERAAAFSPYFVGETVDVVRGKDKFDKRVINYTLRKGKKSFIEALEKYEAAPEVSSETSTQNTSDYTTITKEFESPIPAVDPKYVPSAEPATAPTLSIVPKQGTEVEVPSVFYAPFEIKKAA